jgi:hypothetical protein
VHLLASDDVAAVVGGIALAERSLLAAARQDD